MISDLPERSWSRQHGQHTTRPLSQSKPRRVSHAAHRKSAALLLAGLQPPHPHFKTEQGGHAPLGWNRDRWLQDPHGISAPTGQTDNHARYGWHPTGEANPGRCTASQPRASSARSCGRNPDGRTARSAPRPPPSTAGRPNDHSTGLSRGPRRLDRTCRPRSFLGLPSGVRH